MFKNIINYEEFKEEFDNGKIIELYNPIDGSFNIYDSKNIDSKAAWLKVIDGQMRVRIADEKESSSLLDCNEGDIVLVDINPLSSYDNLTEIIILKKVSPYFKIKYLASNTEKWIGKQTYEDWKVVKHLPLIPKDYVKQKDILIKNDEDKIDVFYEDPQIKELRRGYKKETGNDIWIVEKEVRCKSLTKYIEYLEEKIIKKDKKIL